MHPNILTATSKRKLMGMSLFAMLYQMKTATHSGNLSVEKKWLHPSLTGVIPYVLTLDANVPG